VNKKANPAPVIPQPEDLPYNKNAPLHLGFAMPKGHKGLYKPSQDELDEALEFWRDTEIRKVQELYAHLTKNKSLVNNLKAGNRK